MKKLVLSLAVVLGVGTMVSCGGSKAEKNDSVCEDTTCVKEAAEEEVACDSLADTANCDTVKVEEVK